MWKRMLRKLIDSFAKSAAVLVFFLVCLSTSHANSSKIDISVTHTGDDSVGAQFAFQVREQLRRSSGFRLVDIKESLIEVRLVTLNLDDSPNRNNWSGVTIALTMANLNKLEKNNPQTFYPIYLTALLYTVGSNQVEAQARSLMGAIDAAVEKVKRDSR